MIYFSYRREFWELSLKCHIGIHVGRGVFRRNGILTLSSLYILDCLKLLYKNRSLFESYENDRYPVRFMNIQYPKHHLTLTEKHPDYMCRKLFNKLPSRLKGFGPYKDYVKNIRKFLLELEPYCLSEYFSRNS